MPEYCTVKKMIEGFWRNKKIERSGGFTQAAPAHAYAISTLEEVIRDNYDKLRGGPGDRHCPLRHRIGPYLSYQNSRNYPERPTVIPHVPEFVTQLRFL